MEVKRLSEGEQSHLSSLSVGSDDQWTVNVGQDIPVNLIFSYITNKNSKFIILRM